MKAMKESWIIEDLSATAGGKEVLKAVNLTVKPGEVHLIMGPNGSGKSTLASALSGRPGVEVTAGKVWLDGNNLLELSVEQRALSGQFIAEQYPVEVPGLGNAYFLRAMANARRQAMGEPAWDAFSFLKEAKRLFEQLNLPESFLQRGLNAGMSGGEKKRNELAQLHFFDPALAFLDEIDSGLDVDAVKRVGAFLKDFMRRPGKGLVIVTHYAAWLDVFPEAKVHLFGAGTVQASGGAGLARSIQAEGFEKAKGAA